jgi:ectoine hydroxylase-related dioxygenase (phytanoyl-CoA dioxygenase family)
MMDTDCLKHALTEEERIRFERDGYFVLEDAMSTTQVAGLTEAYDRIVDEACAGGQYPDKRFTIRDVLWRDPLFLDLLDWPTTLPKVWGILGWNIQAYHTVLMYRPPEPGKTEVDFLGWHQDSGQLNQDLEVSPRPRISIKVAFFLSDCSEPGRANFWAIPGSHLQDELERPADGSAPEGSVPILVPAGGAVLFDRRIWHASSANISAVTRKALFYGYSYRWLRPRDDQSVEKLFGQCEPIRRQLLGYSETGGYGYTSPAEEDVPLRGWLREHVGDWAAA